MTNRARRDPPLTGTPLDYVPIDAPIKAIAPTRYRSPYLRRAVIAAIVAALVLWPLSIAL